MPQTLLALLALSISSLVVLNQQRLTQRAQTNMIGNEIQLASSGLASDILAMVGARSFDEQTTPEKIHSAKAVPQEPSGFTPAGVLGSADPTQCDLLAPTAVCDDVDDINRLANARYSILLAEGRELEFDVSTRVVYVTDAEGKTVATVPTRHKKVSIEVRATNKGIDVAPLSFARVFSYDPVKAEMDYEREYGPLGTDKKSDPGPTDPGTIVING